MLSGMLTPLLTLPHHVTFTQSILKASIQPLGMLFRVIVITELIEPAVKGTIGMLQSAFKHGSAYFSYDRNFVDRRMQICQTYPGYVICRSGFARVDYPRHLHRE